MPQVYVDESQIEQVILNLFLNAVDAMPEGGKISITTALEKKKKPLGKNRLVELVCVKIKDTGYGIPVEKQEKIFNPFYTTKSDGVGLGLSISTRLLEENGGTIEVESKLGKGSLFTVYLPVSKEII